MIDTISMELSGVFPPLNSTFSDDYLQKFYPNAHLYHYIMSWDNRKVIQHVDYTTIDFTKPLKLSPKKTPQKGLISSEILYTKKTGNKEQKLSWNNKHNPSSNYKLQITAVDHQDKLKFELSIPKYFYGTNILQTIDNEPEKSFFFDTDKLNSQKFHIQSCYSRIRNYIKTFFELEFGGIKIDYTLLKINRLDFCYNQHFKSKQDALTYLKQIEKVPKSFSRTGRPQQLYKNEINNDDIQQLQLNTIAFPGGKEYYFKVYHKGTEYNKNDKSEHLKFNQKLLNNPSSKIKPFPVEDLQNFSDKILRYELTVRPRYMTYLFMTKAFRKNSDDFKILKELYNKIKNLVSNSSLFTHYSEQDYKDIELAMHNNKIPTKDIISDNTKSLIRLYTGKYLKGHKLDIIDTLCLHFFPKWNAEKSDFNEVQKTSALQKFFFQFDKMITSHRHFYFDLNFDDEKLYLDDVTTNKNFLDFQLNYKMSQHLIELCANRMFDFIKDIQVKNITDIQSISLLIDKHNNQIKKENLKIKIDPINSKLLSLKRKSPLDKNRLMFIVYALKDKSLKELKELLQIPDSTYMRYQRELKILGIDKNTKMNTLDIYAPLGYIDYYNETVINSQKYFINDISNRLNFKSKLSFMTT